MTGKGVVRSIKNYAKGFSDVQRKVREATSNDAWGPSGTLMNEIAQCTFNQHDFIEVMDMIDKRLNDKGKNWRHVFKALLLLDYCLHVGSENVVLYAKENIYVIKTLKEFQHVDDSGRDVGANVRQKAKDITNLLTDDARLKDERRQRQQMRDRMAGVNDYMSDAMGIRSNAPSDFGGSSGPGQFNGGGRGGGAPGGGRGGDSEDRELQRALEESRRMAEAEERKRLENQGDEDLAKAIQLSEQEAKDKERKQREKLERENQDKLFGNSTNNNAQSASFNPFPQNQSFDSSLNPYQQQQQQQQQWPQNTGMTNMTFGDPIGAAGNPQLSFQNTGMVSNPYQQQQQQQLQPQQSNPYQQFSGFGGSLQAQMTGLPQQATGLAPFQTSTVTGFQQPQLTAASNNPFGQFGATSQQTSSATLGAGSFAQTLSASPTFTSTSLANRSPSLSVANVSSSAAGQSRSFTFPSSPSLQPTATQASSSPLGDGRHAKLNALLANREDGMDTFGNTGNLRFPT
ncbi:hypothetical protein BJV82DRAFT_592221 [Fennellomyces sp. T-0311]|nr:hypothetical protein BJV82DRAFT_592221 [Fennellomyces sp. T-0311]